MDDTADGAMDESMGDTMDDAIPSSMDAMDDTMGLVGPSSYRTIIIQTI